MNQPTPHPSDCYWVSDSPDRTWEKCAHTGCNRRRHRPLRDTDATTCPRTPDGKHQWQPLSFVFETQLLDASGRVLIRQPDLDKGRVYAVCMPCRSHTYVETAWVGYYLGYPFLEEEQEHYDGDTEEDESR